MFSPFGPLPIAIIFSSQIIRLKLPVLIIPPLPTIADSLVNLPHSVSTCLKINFSENRADQLFFQKILNFRDVKMV
jgi:hypothetical protein